VSYNKQLSTKTTSLTADSRSALSPKQDEQQPHFKTLDPKTLEPLNHKKSGTFSSQAQPPTNTETMNSAQRATLA
jgi:hypothetical protein